MIRKAIIISISGPKLTLKEKKLFKKPLPWGVILFKRNIKSFSQLKKLTKSIKKITNDKKYPILIDEEGGTVSRLKRIMDTKIFSQRYFGKIYENNKIIGTKIYINYLKEISLILNKLGINLNTTPVLDKLNKKTHNFLISRIYSDKTSTIKNLGQICINIQKKNKIFSVIKHIPGHGLANSDSHKKLPIINKNLNYLLRNDFSCFKNINGLFAMTAHVLYKKIDDKNCVTHSNKLIKEIIRKKLNFKGILISDDISMKSLKHNLVENATKALTAGCNLALYCNGKINDNYKLIKKIPIIDGFTKKKTAVFYKLMG